MFDLDIKQREDAREFIKNHECTAALDEFGQKKFGAIGGGVTYHFTPTGLGVIASVSCTCGNKLDLTNVSDW